MKRMTHIIAGAALASMFAAGTAQAHYLWIEADEAGARLHYGEADVLLKEKSPGKLDNIKAPQAFLANPTGGNPALASLTRTTEYFAIAGSKSASAILASEESLEVKDLTRHGLGVAKTNYYARFGQAGSDSGPSPLALDVKGSGPNRFAVLYRGRPLTGTKVEVIAPNTWMQEYKTDEQGDVEINTPWRGQYVVHVLHVDKTPGDFSGKKYDALRNHFTYTFIKAEGADPGPAVPPRHFAD